MTEVEVGRNGKIVLGVLIVLLGGENLLIWYNSGVRPAIEFLLLGILVIGIVAAVIIEARRRQLT